VAGHIIDKAGRYLLSDACRELDTAGTIRWRQFVLAALNEKWERDFGEPRRWLKGVDGDPNWYKCPVCKNARKGSPFKFCPSCGKRLLRPKEDAE